jgi:Tfp pilus assembly protein PilZ
MKATTHEVSGGGMSLQLPVKLRNGDTMELSLSLPGGPVVKIPAVVRWTKEAEQLTGVRFEDEDARTKVKNWIDKYLGYM